MKQRIILYQVVPRLFGNTNPTCKKNGNIEENGVGKLNDFTPKALKEIKALGCTHIWYTGVIEHATQTDYTSFGISRDNPYVVKGKAGSPYSIKDYYDVDPDLACDIPNRIKEFEALIARSHQEALKVIIDFVPNHVSRQYHSDAKPAGVEDFGASDNPNTAFDPNNNYYYLPGESLTPQFPTGEGDNKYTEFPAKATGNDCFNAYPTINDWYEAVKLNYGKDYHNPHNVHYSSELNTWKKMYDILLYWAKKGVDGFRCDMAEMVPVEFWEWVIPQIKQKYPHIIFIAEVYNPNEYWTYTARGKFDYLYDKVGLYDTLKEVINGNLSASAITSCWQRLDLLTPHMLNFLENHDEQRIASDFFAGDPFKALPALILSATLNTSPYMIYSGQEFGEKGMDEEGFSGKDGRTTIFDYWSVDTLRRWNNEGAFNTEKLSLNECRLRHFYQQLLTLCNQEEALREGAFYDIMYANYANSAFNGNKLFAYLRKSEHSLCLIVVNFNDDKEDCEVVLPKHAFEWLQIEERANATWIDLLAGGTATAPLSLHQPIPLILPPRSGIIFKTAIE